MLSFAKSPESVFDKDINKFGMAMINKLSPSDRIIIGELNPPVRGSLSTVQWDWIEENI